MNGRSPLLIESEHRVIRTSEAARRLNVSERSIRRWLQEGRLKPLRLLGDQHRYVSTDEVERLRAPIELERAVGGFGRGFEEGKRAYEEGAKLG